MLSLYDRRPQLHVLDSDEDNNINFERFLSCYDFLCLLQSIFDQFDYRKGTRLRLSSLSLSLSDGACAVGYVGRAQLVPLLARYGYQFKEGTRVVDLLFKMMDARGTGQITYAPPLLPPLSSSSSLPWQGWL